MDTSDASAGQDTHAGGNAHAEPEHHKPAAVEHSNHVHQASASGQAKVMSVSLGPRGKEYLRVCAVYLLIALVAFAPIAMNMSTTATGTGGDTYLNMWDIWWVNYAVYTAHTSIWFTPLVFWPVGENLVYHTLAPLAGLLAGPMSLVSLPFAYDSLFFIGFMLSGLTMYILADYFVANKYASFVAGLVFSFSASHIDHSYGLLIFTQIEWIPLALYFMVRMVKEKRRVFAAGLGISFMLATFMGNVEQSVMLLVLLVIVLLLYAINEGTRKLVLAKEFLVNAVIAVVVCFIVGIWGFLPLISTLSQPGALSLANQNNTPQSESIWSADLLTFFVPSYYNSIFYPVLQNSSLYLPDPSERVAYIGYTVIALALLALLNEFKSSRMWLVVVVIFAWLSLGPSLLVFGNNTGIPTLYTLYSLIPGLSIIREPGRFALITALGFAMLAAIGMKYVLQNWRNKFSMPERNFYLLATAGFAFLYLLEVNGLVMAGAVESVTMTYVSVPQLYTDIAQIQSQNFSTFTLPALPGSGLSPDLYPGMATFYQAFTHKPIVGGLDGRYTPQQLLSIYNIPLTTIAEELELNPQSPPTYVSPVVQNYTNQTLLSLYNYNTGVVILDKGAFTPSDALLFESYLGGVFGNYIYQDNSTIAFDAFPAENSSVYRSFVAYPNLDAWQGVSIPLNGSQSVVWVPYSQQAGGAPGEVTVYAPCKLGSISQCASQAQSGGAPINATINFTAFAQSDYASLDILQLVGNGTQLRTVAAVNLTAAPREYSVHIEMYQAPLANVYFFSPSYRYTYLNQSGVYVSNIRFS